jgi:hypothetical protein
LFHVVEHLGHLPYVSKDLGLPLGGLVEGLGCQAYALGLMPKLLGCLPSVFVHPTLFFGDFPAFLGMLTLCFRALTTWLIPAHGTLYSLGTIH